jgi:periplasmic mercuric ion binding protein
MNKINNVFASVALMVVLSAPVSAATKTITLNVPGMTCPACPITINKALNKVQGVSKVEISLEKKQAVVTFDDTKADTKTLVKATTESGYPSQPEGEKK